MFTLIRLNLIVLILWFFSSISFSQLLVEEFDYNTGSLDTVSGFSWVRYSGSYNPIQVVDGNLSYPGYPSSDIGRMIQIVASDLSSMDYYRGFQLQESGTIYTAFLLNVIDTIGLHNYDHPVGEFFIGYYSVSSQLYFALVSIRKGSGDGPSYQLGIRVNEERNQVEWYNASFNVNQTYLVVFAYTIIPGDSNDVAMLWINPDLTPTPPDPNVQQVSNTLDPVNVIQGIGIRQGRREGGRTPNAFIDGLRVATNWNDAPLPIQLGMMVASYVDHNSVLIEWETITEINNYGFYVERYHRDKQCFVTIEESFQPGAGYSLQPRRYSWLDENVNEVALQYRLKQVDNDGLISYYGPIMLNPNSVRDRNNLNAYKLSQNYPNPFNPKTTIEFNLPIEGFVKLQVMNTLGQQVALLIDRTMNAGTHSVVFDASELPSGVYYYKLNTGNFVEVKKMILAK